MVPLILGPQTGNVSIFVKTLVISAGKHSNESATFPYVPIPLLPAHWLLRWSHPPGVMLSRKNADQIANIERNKRGIQVTE